MTPQTGLSLYPAAWVAKFEAVMMRFQAVAAPAAPWSTAYEMAGIRLPQYAVGSVG